LASYLRVTVNLPKLSADPWRVVNVIGPLLAPVGTVAVTEFSEDTENLGAATPLKRTDVVVLRLRPVMVTTVPTGPEPGLNDAISGAVLKSLPR